ncbi:MAG: hypothetical protein ACE141_18050 [Bryobacteraceae bacterium]
MAELETNIYRITNLNELSSRYRLVEVVGLRSDQAEYFQNRETLERRLSYSLRKPVIVIERDGIPYVVVPEDVAVLPSDISLVRVVVQLRPKNEKIELDYTRRGEDDAIALRFLRFLIQAPLRGDSRLWQPAAGRPFFERVPARSDGVIDRYVGFSVRPVVTPDAGIGLCVDVTSCYVGARPLPVKLSRDEFASAWKARNCVYRFGQDWYEVHLRALADRTVKDYRFIKDGKTWSLLDYVLDRASRPLPSDLANLPEDSAVVLYQDTRGNELGAPAPLCYPVFHTSSEEVARQHGRAILAPHERRGLTRAFVDRYFRGLRFGNIRLRISTEPLGVPGHGFKLPDLQFGHKTVLSVRGNPGAVQARLAEFGSSRLQLLKDPKAGFYESAPLDRQYLILPRSICDTIGDRFVNDLSRVVDEFFPQPGGYSPVIVPYDDRGQRTFVRQARALRAAAEAKCTQPGYALVMVHRTADRGDRDEDQLAAMVVRELRRQFDIRAAVIHSDVPRRSYKEDRGSDGRVVYSPVEKQEKKFSGYLRNVAITKILLTNQRWPFVLATPLHADVTVGVDVKNNTAGLLVVGAHGSDIRSELRESRQKEQLLASQTSTYMSDVLRREAEMRGRPLAAVVIHRDGRTWPSELRGIHQALDRLKSEGSVATNAGYAVVEVSKSSPAPLRMYDLDSRGQATLVRNPLVGATYRIGEREAYLCTTGGPFLRQGTAHPLHLIMIEGTLPFSECLEDLYALSALTWTQPEGCTRFPITIKLNDRILAAEAGDYDVDAIEFADAAAADVPVSEEVA